MIKAARALWLALLLVGCASETGSPGETLRFLAASLDEAWIGEPYARPVHAVGGLRPYDYRLESGSLPPGIELVGGSLEGVPTVLGTYTFTIAVSDANLSSTFQEFTLRVVEPPPPTLTLSVPATEVRGEVTLRARVSEARGLAAMSSEVSWDPDAFELVEGSVRAAGRESWLLHQASAGRLQVDLALLGTTVDGSSDLFRFALRPLSPPAVPSLSVRADVVSSRGGERITEAAVVVAGASRTGAVR